MGLRTGFELAVSQNKFLSTEDDEMHAVLTVTAYDAGAGPVAAPEAAEVIAIDCSGSMNHPPTKMVAAQRATRAAIDALRDGVFFAVVEGTHLARMVYPTTERLVAATPETKAAAKAAVGQLFAAGGTAMGRWLKQAQRLLDGHPTAVRHVMLLTDGKNETETRAELDAVLADCERSFVCDARGIGEHWVPEELLRIVSTLHGAADAVREDAELVADFGAMMRAAMAKVVPDLRLQIRTAPFAQLRFVKQVFLTEADLTEFGRPVDARTTQFSTGSWGNDDRREYHVCLRVQRGDSPTGDDLLAARVDLAILHAGNEKADLHGKPEAIQVHWTSDLKLSSVLDPKVAHYTDQAELGEAVRVGCDAYDAGDRDRATTAWGHAVRIAAKLGNDQQLTRLRRLVDIVGDPADGNVRIKANPSPVDLLASHMGSVISTHSPESAAGHQTRDATPADPDRKCPVCDHICPGQARFCANCGHKFSEAV